MTDQPSQADFPFLPQATITATLLRIANALPQVPGATPEDRVTEMKAAAAAISGMRPRDPMEAALAARIVLMQCFQMDCYRRANQPGLPVALRLRLVSQAATLCRLEDTTIRALHERQARPVVAPAVLQVKLPEVPPQAPYVAPQAEAGRKAPTRVAVTPARQTVSATETVSVTQGPAASTAAEAVDAESATATREQLMAELAARAAAAGAKLAA